MKLEMRYLNSATGLFHKVELPTAEGLTVRVDGEEWRPKCTFLHDREGYLKRISELEEKIARAGDADYWLAAFRKSELRANKLANTLFDIREALRRAA